MAVGPGARHVHRHSPASSARFAELLRVRGAHRQQLFSPPDLDFQRAAETAIDAIDRADIDHDATVNLPEDLRIELLLELPLG